MLADAMADQLADAMAVYSVACLVVMLEKHLAVLMVATSEN